METELPPPLHTKFFAGENNKYEYNIFQEFRRESTKRRTIQIQTLGGGDFVRLTLPPIIFLLQEAKVREPVFDKNISNTSTLHAFVEKFHEGKRYLSPLPLPHVRYNGEVCIPFPPTKKDDLLPLFWGSPFRSYDYLIDEGHSQSRREIDWECQFERWKKGPEHLKLSQWYVIGQLPRGDYYFIPTDNPFSKKTQKQKA